jgi:type IV pilus assembly protein PilV
MRMKTALRARHVSTGGYMLIEVLVCILLILLGVLGLLSMQARSIQAAGDAKLRTNAVFAVNETLGRMWVDRGNLASYAGTKALAALPNGQSVVTVNGAVVTVTITWRPPGTSADRKFVSAATLASN